MDRSLTPLVDVTLSMGDIRSAIQQQRFNELEREWIAP